LFVYFSKLHKLIVSSVRVYHCTTHTDYVFSCFMIVAICKTLQLTTFSFRRKHSQTNLLSCENV